MTSQYYFTIINVIQDENDDECVYCRNKKQLCNDIESCYRCVKNTKKQSCNYKRQEKVIEKFRIHSYFVFNDEKEIVRDESQIAKIEILKFELVNIQNRFVKTRKKNKSIAISILKKYSTMNS